MRINLGPVLGIKKENGRYKGNDVFKTSQHTIYIKYIAIKSKQISKYLPRACFSVVPQKNHKVSS